MSVPRLLHTVLDSDDVRGTAEFWRQLLDLRYREGDEMVSEGEDWLVLTDHDGNRKLAFQLTDDLQRSTWPEPGVPMQLHLDLTGTSPPACHARAVTDAAQWLLTRLERANPRTRIDDTSPDGAAWTEGNLVVPLIDGAAYFADLHAVVSATRPGDLVLFTDWQGDADQQLTADAGSDVLSVFGGADERGVDVRGLVWRSHLDQAGFFATANRHFGEQMQSRGAEVLLDMRVRTGGSHHQKLVVVRHRDDPSRDVAWIGGIDLAHNRRDDPHHLGDPQGEELSEEYGETPPWHDVQVRIQGPAVHAIETVFRERWEDPTPLTRNPIRRVVDVVRRHDTTPDPLPAQASPPPAAGHLRVQLLRTYPNLRHGLDYPFARGGERSVALGYRKALEQARTLVYVEDQYFWGSDVADPFVTALEANPELRVLVVLPTYPDVEGVSRRAELLARSRALQRLREIAPDRVAAYGLENTGGTPIYVHAKVCVMDDIWATVGSDNFNRRSWTHDSELSCVVLDSDYATRLRLRLASEHLGRLGTTGSQDDVLSTMSDCVDPLAMYDAYAAAAQALDDWHAGGRVGPRPVGHLRSLPLPAIGAVEATVLTGVLDRVHDPDGRPAPLRRRNAY